MLTGLTLADQVTRGDFVLALQLLPGLARRASPVAELARRLDGAWMRAGGPRLCGGHGGGGGGASPHLRDRGRTQPWYTNGLYGRFRPKLDPIHVVDRALRAPVCGIRTQARFGRV
ncbi:hypothetical protein BH20ACT21_BH20ACT21_24640 [soil metagenome]